MSDDDNVTPFPPPKLPRRPRKPTTKTTPASAPGEVEIRRIEIPTLPHSEFDMDTLRRNATSPTKRAWAAFAMRKRMIPFEEIAEYLEFESPAHAKAAIAGVLAATVKPEDTETLRQIIIGGLEDQLRRSVAMASADYFEDADGNRYPNESRIAWHREVRQDYEVLAKISGAQAAAQIQLVNPESAELDQIVRALEQAQGRAVVEPEVLVLEVLDDAAG